MHREQYERQWITQKVSEDVGGRGCAAGFPSIVPASVFGQKAPSNRINIGAIGVGRISRVHDLPGIWQFEQARIMAVAISTPTAWKQEKSWSTATMPRRQARTMTA